MAKSRVCSIPDCGKRHEARGYCRRHYMELVPASSRGDIYAPRNAGLAFLADAAKSKSADCILWPYAIDKDGYGVTYVNRKWSGAHRAVCVLAHGEQPAGIVARHSCRNRSCVNPNHLCWGTNLDNVHDAMRDGTHAKGERNHNAKLTAADIVEIRNAPPSTKHTELARRFGVTPTNIIAIRRRNIWKHVA